MNPKIKNLFSEQRGSTLVFFSLLLVIILGMIGIALDGGTLFVTKVHLQKTANAAVLSGAQELFNNETTITNIVDTILYEHDEQNSLDTLTIEMNNKVTLHLKKTVTLSFLSLFGFEKTPVEVRATAKVVSMGRGRGAAPLGIDDSIPLEFYKSYKLKVDQTEVSAGNFGILALEGPGAKTYEDNLRNGYSGEIKVGDMIETQTGNIAGKTRTVINERINACTHQIGDLHHRDCSRILLVPVYTPHNFTSNQLKIVKVTGFAYFYILEPMTIYDTSVTGMFIERVGTGFGDENNINNGAYTVKLTK
ncbi:Tad domain-containing protein [Crassaminicella profunda]|uniref:Tad domain-containing protein n=1 Tax=Crassaminicella profunda TaxID=1286698 RepID=UPI001CA7A154|nr:Tad domain-containing protein [Crassaminicella profunda]QZY55407.1 Tad domain-containing protein [Crassaminicella profunda]